MAKEQKTAEELMALLRKRIATYQLASTVNPRLIKIILADPAKEAANWKVSHSSRKFPAGDLARAIDRAAPELQNLYDLKTK